MSDVKVFDMQGNEKGNVSLNDSIFGIEPNEAAMHTMVVNYLAAQRQGTQSALTRSEVSGGGRKPWRQKGTGRARQGSTRSPQWYHGGVAFAPKPRSYRFSVNKKVRRLALKSAFSCKAQSDEIIIVDEIKLDEIKTQSVVKMLSALGADKKALIVLADMDKNVILSARNIKGVKSSQVNELNVYDILNADKLIIAKGALEKIEEVYA